MRKAGWVVLSLSALIVATTGESPIRPRWLVLAGIGVILGMVMIVKDIANR